MRDSQQDQRKQQQIKQRLRKLCVNDYGEALLELLCATEKIVDWSDLTTLVNKKWLDDIVLANQPRHSLRILWGDEQAKSAFAKAFSRRLSHPDTLGKLKRYWCWTSRTEAFEIEAQKILHNLLTQYFSDLFVGSYREKNWRQIQTAIKYLEAQSDKIVHHQPFALAQALLNLYRQPLMPNTVIVPEPFKTQQTQRVLNEKMLGYLYEYHFYAENSLRTDAELIGKFLPEQIENMTFEDMQPCFDELLPKQYQAITAKIAECQDSNEAIWSQDKLAKQAGMQNRKTWKSHYEQARQKLGLCLQHLLNEMIADDDTCLIETPALDQESL